MNRLNILAAYICVLIAFTIGLTIGSCEAPRDKNKPIVNISPKPNTLEPKVFYLISAKAYSDINNRVVLILDYSKNGETQSQCVFDSSEERNTYVQHLETLGVVLNKGILR